MSGFVFFLFFCGPTNKELDNMSTPFSLFELKEKTLIGTIDATKRPEQLAVGPFFHPSPNVFEYNQTLTFSYQIKTESSRNCVLRHDVSGARFFFLVQGAVSLFFCFLNFIGSCRVFLS